MHRRSRCRSRVADRGRGCLALALLTGLGLLACSGESPADRSSILLFVMDTTRADAISAYGAVEGTSPTLDRLAADGLRYERAYAQAPWTLPSHATLFTGLLPSEHGVSWQQPRASDALVTVAERLREAGYQTAGFSENVWIGPTFNMTQGFEHSASGPEVSVEDEIASWLAESDPDRPFFLFVNVLDPHSAYKVRQENPHLPAGWTPAEARLVYPNLRRFMCRDDLLPGLIDLLHGLYLGEVMAADTKLERVLALLGNAGRGSDTITVVTSDHGEHFGEHRLFSHQFSLHQPLLHVPLVVHGLPGVEPGVVAEAVQHLDIVPSLLGWAGLPIPDRLAGRLLPTSGQSASPRAGRAIVAEYSDPARSPARRDPVFVERLRKQGNAMRENCPPGSRVFGDLQSVVRYPYKLIAFEHLPPALYDLERDPGEERDLAAENPDLVAELLALLAVVPREPLATPALPAPVPDAVRDELEALGYLDE